MGSEKRHSVVKGLVVKNNPAKTAGAAFEKRQLLLF